MGEADNSEKLLVRDHELEYLLHLRYRGPNPGELPLPANIIRERSCCSLVDAEPSNPAWDLGGEFAPGKRALDLVAPALGVADHG